MSAHSLSLKNVWDSVGGKKPGQQAKGEEEGLPPNDSAEAVLSVGLLWSWSFLKRRSQGGAGGQSSCITTGLINWSYLSGGKMGNMSPLPMSDHC